MEDKLQQFYDILKGNATIKGLPDTYDDFRVKMQDEKVSSALFNALKQNSAINGLPADYATFAEGLSLKKKVPTAFPLPSIENLQEDFQKRQKESEGFSVVPSQSQSTKTNYEDTLPEDITIEAVNRADKSRMDYLSGEAKKIEAGVIERVKQEATALSKKYQGPELEQKLDDLYELRSGEMQKAVETLAGETQYKFIDKDVKNYSNLFGNILDSNNTHGQKVQQIADLRQNILNSIPEEGRAVVKGELNRLISDLATQSPMGQQFLLKTSVATTRDKLIAAHDKLKAETDRKMRGAGIDPTAIAAAPPMFENEVDELSRLQGAIDFMNRALDVPESKEGAIGDAFKSELGNILTAGVSGLLENIEVMQSARKENPTEADKALVDAYGQLQQLQGLASDNVDRYRRAKSLVGSIPYMEQFLLTGGIGDYASTTAKKVGESVLKKGIKNRIAQAAVKRLVEPVTEGAISMIGRVPIMPMTYKNIAEAGVALKEEDGKFVIDPAQMPTIGKAIGEGVYQSATEVFSESLGGVFALPKWKWADKIITPSAKKLFTRVGMQNPFGEYGEEIFANLFQGEKIDREFLGDLLMTIPIMTGGFAVLSTPAIVKDLKMAKKKVPSAPVVENLIEAKDEKGLLDMVTEAVMGKTKAEALDIVEGVGAMVQENVADEMTAKVDTPTEKVVGKNGNTYIPEILIRESGKDKVRVLNDNGEEVSSLTMRTVDVDGEKYWSVIQLATATGEENNGLATAVYRQALNNLPEGYKGIISPAESRINKTEIPRVHQKLAAEFDMEVKENGDIIFRRPPANIETPIETKTESGTQVSLEGDMPTLTTPSELNTGEIQGTVTPKTEATEIAPQKEALPEKSTFNYDTEEMVIGKDIVDDIKAVEDAARTMSADEFSNFYLSVTAKIWDEGGRRTTERSRAFDMYFRSLLPEGELAGSRSIREAILGTIGKRWIVKTDNISIKAHNEDVVARIDDKGKAILEEMVAFTAKKYPDKKLDISIGLQPISVAGSDGFRMTVPDLEAPISDMFPYDAKLVIPAYEALEKEGADRRTLWAAHDFFHEMAHTEGIQDEREADAFAVKHVQEFISSRAETPQVQATPLKVEEENQAIPLKSPKDLARENLRAKWENLKNIGVAYDPRSQAEAQVEFTKALLEYIKQEVLDTAAKIKAEVKEIFGHDLSDADAEYLLGQTFIPTEPVFHGTPYKIDEFNTENGVYFTPNKKYAEHYKGEIIQGSVTSERKEIPSSNVVEATISMSNPKLFGKDFTLPTMRSYYELTPEKIRQYKDQGYDGLIFVVDRKAHEYVVFDKTQIKISKASPPVVPPAEPPVVEQTEQPEGDNTFERETLRKMRDESTLSPEFKEWLDKNGITTTRLPNNVTSAEVDYIIASNGLDKASIILKDSGNNLPLAVRNLMGVRLAKAYDDLAVAAGQNGDLEGENLYRVKALEIAHWIGDTSTDTARGLQILGSTEALGILSPKTLVMNAEREARRQRDKGISKSKKDIASKKKSLSEAQEEAVDELTSKPKYKEEKRKVTRGEVGARKQVPKDVLAKERKFRETKWAELRKAREAAKGRDKSIGFAATPLHADEVAIAGEIVRSYVRSGYYKIEDIVKRLQKEWKKFMGDDLDYDTAVTLIPKETDGKPTEDLMRENAEEKAAETLSKRVVRMLDDPKTPKDDPIKLMVNTLFAKVKEKDTKKPELKKKSDIEKIREAIINKKEYAGVWEEAKKLVDFMISSNENLSEETKADYTQRLQKFYDDVIGEPFSQKQVESAAKDAMKELDIQLDEIVKQHYTVYDATRRTLQEKLIDDLGLTEEDARMFAEAVGREFDKIATDKKRKALLRGIKPKETLHPKQAKATWEKLIEITNLGAWSDAEFAEAYAEKWGMPSLTEEQRRAIERFAEMVQKAPEGYKKFEVTQDMLRYIAKLEGMDLGEVGMAIWYASILSGPRTQFKNVFANMVMTLFEFMTSARRPQFIPKLAYGLVTGWGHGAREAAHIFKSGYTPIRYGKIEVPPILEQWRFKGGKYNPANYAKYIARVMMAADAFSYHGLKEMRAWELALLEARKEGKGKPAREHWAKATEMLYRTKERKAEAELRATQEGLKGNEFHRRVWEIMEQSRPLQMEEETNDFAARGTFNHQPEGLLGRLTDLISRGTQDTVITLKVPFSNKKGRIRVGKFLIPFTRIISNVTNVALNYTPWGFVRGVRGGIGMEAWEDKPNLKRFRREYTEDERQRVVFQASVGVTAMMLALWLSGDDEDGEPVIQITANGSGDYRKNYELKQTGWQPYSVNIGHRWYSYQYTPLFLALAPIGYLRDLEKYKREDISEMSTSEIFQAIVFKTASAMSDMSWMTSLAGVLDAMSSENLADSDRFLKNFFSSTIKGAIYPKLIEQVAQMIDEGMQNPRKEGTGFMGKIARDLPIARKGMNDMLNATGDPVMYDPYMMTSKDVSDPFWNYVVDHNAWIGKPSQKGTQVYDDKTGEERGLTDDEYYQYVRLSGQAIKLRILNEVMTEDLSDEDIKRSVDGIKSTERKKAREMMFGWSGVRDSNPKLWSFLVDNDLLPTRGSVKIGGKTISDNKELDAYWKDVEKMFGEFLSEVPSDKLTKEEKAVWKDEVVDLMWGMAQDAVKTQRESDLGVQSD